MSKPIATLLFAAALAIAVRGQGRRLVVPPRFQSVEAPSYTSFPFGRSTPVRMQIWVAPGFFTSKGTLTRVALRGNGGGKIAAKKVELEIFAGTGPGSPRAVASTFSANRGRDHQAVFKRRTVQLPALPASNGPRPFQVVFALDAPLAYDPAAGGLLVEFVIHGQMPGTYPLDLGSTCTSRRGNHGAAGCRGSNGLVPVADVPTSALRWGEKFVMRVRNALGNAPVVMLVGSTASGSWLGLKIPYPLDRAGAPGCTLNNDVLLVLAAAADRAGTATVLGRIPDDPRLFGTWYHFQAACFDSRANPLGVTLSNGSRTEICGPDPVVRVIATRLAALTGQIEIGVIPVVEFSLR